MCAAQPDAAARLDQVLAAHAAELRVVPDQVGQLAALLDEVAGREARDLLFEARHAEQLAQHDARIVEAERLVEIRRQRGSAWS